MSKYNNVTTEDELFEIWKQKKPEKIKYNGYDEKINQNILLIILMHL